jgi:hypothetical protein
VKDTRALKWGIFIAVILGINAIRYFGIHDLWGYWIF